MITRMSRTIASSILRKLSACASAALELDLVELADAVYEVGHFLAEPPVDLLLERRRVLDHVVEDGCDQRLRIEPQVREQIGDGDRVRDVRLAGAATLTLVSLEAKS